MSIDNTTFFDRFYEISKEIFNTDFKNEQERKNHFILRLCEEAGGEHIYLPKGIIGASPTSQALVKARHSIIKSEFNGRNIRELCKKYKVSPQVIYNILRKKDDK